MRKWIPVALIVVAVLWFILQNIGYSMAMAEFSARPIIAFNRDGSNIPVQQSGQKPLPGEARGLGGKGAMFGFRITFALPDGTLVTCTQRFRSLTCDGGWSPERAGQ